MAQQGQPQYNQAPPSQHPSQHQPGYPPPGPGAPVVMVGEGVCPKCGGMLLTDNNAFICGLLWAFFCFPFGLICLSSMWKKRCVSCGFEVPQCC
ncbi:brain protein I3-like [Folsomia candida]|uniref:brain protein I3-like n=1 Tax=Folsomia candida TaxID=158441 RepID=UPI0016052D5D|nr:brain protein I3-like [Folsomia candida]